MSSGKLSTLFVSIAFCLATFVAIAQDDTSFDPLATVGVLEEIEGQIAAESDDAAFLAKTRTTLISIQLQAENCESAANAEHARLEQRFAPYKDIEGDSTGSDFGQYREIKQLLDDSARRHSQCFGVNETAQRLVSNITSLQNSISQQFLSHRSESIIGSLRTLPERIAAVPEKLQESMVLELVPGITLPLLFWALLGSAALAGVIGVFVRRQFYKSYNAAGGDDGPSKFKFLFPKPLADHAPVLLQGTTLVAVLWLATSAPTTELLVLRLAIGIVLFGIGRVVIDWSTGPLSPSAAVKGLIPDHVKPLRLRLVVFLIALVSSFVVLGTRWLAIRMVAPDVVGRATMIFVVAIALLYAIAYLGKIPGLRGRFRLIRYAGTLALIAGIFLLMIGFHNFAGYLVHGVTRTALALLLLWILLWCVLTLFEYLIKQETPSAHQIRRSLGVTDQATRSGLGFMQLVADLVIWLGFVFFVIYVWDDSGTTLDSLYETAIGGITIGQLTLVPINILGGILVFVGLIIVIGWMKRWIDRRWLQHIVIERGAREAVITIFGYVGFVVAVLTALAYADVDLTGLAFASAALALGIGFGMQEIANNFVSGLILLFERPIRTGDFVTVGEMEGFVRRIRIRATEIETLDNQNVLVPNSELISGRVTNWVLRDTAGRLQIPIGVAYGSDVAKVKDILEAVSTEHSEVITDGSAAAPRALFMRFGDSSLDFELRVRIYRIERRFSVQSDINFAIDAAFRTAGISIPFPQRDLHVISYPDDSVDKIAEKDVAPAEKSDDDSQRAQISVDNITRSHTEEIQTSASTADCWKAVTNIDDVLDWLASEGEFKARIGGKFDLVLRDGSQLAGRVDIYIPNYRMRLALAPGDGEDPLASGPITVTIQLRSFEGGTRILVTVAGIPANEDWEEDYKRSESRWQQALADLAELINSQS